MGRGVLLSGSGRAVAGVSVSRGINKEINKKSQRCDFCLLLFLFLFFVNSNSMSQ